MNTLLYITGSIGILLVIMASWSICVDTYFDRKQYLHDFIFIIIGTIYMLVAASLIKI